ncbi:MAG: DALR domain-containing protein, partial [Bacteroidales bacterium]|nr:DALR domain-containing protein [Bacteroidales bacterium]
TAATGHQPVNYWMHNNMITINGQKMGKSLNNFITLDELFSGNHSLLNQPYHPMTIRFFILQAHYRSTLDFSNDALQAAEKGLKRLTGSLKTINTITASDEKSSIDVKALKEECYQAMNDDFNSPIAIAKLFDGIRFINAVADGNASINEEDIEIVQSLYHFFIVDVFGLDETDSDSSQQYLDEVMTLLIDIRNDARRDKDFAIADRIRDELAKHNIVLKDTKDGTDWELTG